MVLHSKIANKMKEGFLCGLFIGIGIVPMFIFYTFADVDFSYLVFGLLMVFAGSAIYAYWHTMISSITSNVDTQLRKLREQSKTEVAGQHSQDREVEKITGTGPAKRIFPEDLCFDIKVKPGSRDSKPLMIVTFKKSRNYTPDKHEWVPKPSEIEFLEQRLNKMSSH
jgi:hypothetical protein